MPNKKISELAAAAALTGAELVEAVQNGQNVKTTTQDIADLGGGGPGSADWGDIGGTLSDQTDLQAALDQKTTDLNAHIADTTDAHDASAISFVPTGKIGSANVQAAIAELDTEVDERILDALAGLKWKDAVRVATTGPGTLATDFENGDTVDGVVLATGDRILLKDQADQTENGIRIVAASGAPARSTDADSASELEGAAVSVLEGSTNANTTWLQITDSITLGSSNIVFTQYGSSVPDADETTKGIVERATDAETAAGTDTTRFISPASLKATEGPIVHSTSTLTITDAHHKKTLMFTVNCTVTIPTGLRADLKFDAIAKAGVTLVEFDAAVGVTYYAFNNYNTLRAGQSASFAMQASNSIVGVFGQVGTIEETLLVQDTVTTVVTAADINGLTTTVEENSTYSFEGQLRVACNNTGGIKFGFVTPTGADYCGLFFGQITVTPLVTNRMILVTDGLGATAFCTVAASGFMYIKGTITLGAGESGTFKLQFASNTATQQSTVFGVGSYLTIKKHI